MGTDTMNYGQFGDRVSWPDAARTLMKRLRLPRHKANDGISADRSDASLKARIEELEAQLAKIETSAASHRADFERERERCDRLTLELMRAAIETMNAKEAAARLEGELTILRSRPWWKRLARHTGACGSWITVLLGHAKLKKIALFTRVAQVAQGPRISAAPQ